MTGAAQPDRRALLAAASGLLLPLGACARAAAAIERPPLRCADFLDSIGVNTHVNYADSQYRDAEAIFAALSHIGLKYVRDAAINARNPGARHYEALAASGASFCMFWGAKRPMAEAVAQISALEAAHPGAVHALEGPNEIKPEFAYAGLTGNAAAQRFMIDMRAAARADRRLRDKPLVCFTTYAPVAAECDFANDHPYPKGGQQPAQTLKNIRDRNIGLAGAMPGKPMMFTEFGYHTLVGQPARPGDWQGVDPERQAILILNALFDNAAAGVARTYVYQLFDGYADGGGANQGRHFGLFGFDGEPKPAANALRTLFARLADTGPGAHDFQPRPLAARLAAPAPISSLALRHSKGHGFLALWNESLIWDKTAAAPREITPLAATLALPAPAPMRVLDLVDPAKDHDLGFASTASLSVGAHPLLLRLG